MRHVSTLDPVELPVGWDDPAVLPVTRALGDTWLEERRSVVLRVPSAIVPSEWNALLNPLHPAFRLSWIRGPFEFHWDGRLF
jgi:RES domain-containing protein